MCRPSGDRAAKKLEKRKVRLFSDFKIDLLNLFDVDIDSDVASKHSKALYFKCFQRLRNLRSNANPHSETFLTAQENLAKSESIWQAYDETVTLAEC